MSIRAYRIIEIKQAEHSTFNLWHDDKLMEFFDEKYHFYERLNSDNQGLAELPVTALERALVEVESIDPETQEALRQDIAAAKEMGANYVEYYCY